MKRSVDEITESATCGRSLPYLINAHALVFSLSAVPSFHTIRHFTRSLPLEAWVWTAGLLALAVTDPTGQGLLDFCGWRRLGLLDLVGLERGPGCGLGHSVAFLLDGRLGPALQTHPLGPFALAVLVGRIAALVRHAFRRSTTHHALR